MPLSSTMPEITEHQKNMLGNYLVSYYNPKIKHYCAGKMSFYAFFFYADITDKLEQEDIKRLAYLHGYYEAKDKNGYIVKIVTE